jgi:molybdenum cofactor synthesis domain-containing protein
MRPFASTISLDEARARLAASVRPIQRIERVAIEDASGRVVAADLDSTIDVPPFARSAMDGYAVVAADSMGATRESPRRVRLVGHVFTGDNPAGSVAAGTCMEIATGAPLPPGADAVVMVEDTTISDGEVNILAAVTAGQNIGRRGADIRTGDAVVAAGDVLTASRIGALAAVGCASVEVFARPRVAILSTGNEVVEPGQPLPAAHVYDVNRFTLAALAATHGGAPEPRRPVHDSLDALVSAIDDCAAADVIVFSGGSSVGNRDLILDVVRARGEMIFHGIAVRPGKPTAFAMVNGQTPFFGMPGNPTSCLSNAYVLLIPFLRATARLPPHAPHTIDVPLARRIASAAGRHQFYTVRISDGLAWPAFKGSGDITSLSQADGYIEIPDTVSVIEEKTVVRVTLF